jgi:ferric enterobactin receptor
MRKVTLSILFVARITLCPYFSVAQIDSLGNPTLYEALLYWGEKCHMKLAFDADFAKKISVSRDFKKLDCRNALPELLKGSPLWFVRLNDVHIIKPLKELPEDQRPEVFPTSEIAEVPPSFRIMGLVRQYRTGESLPYSSIIIEGTQRGTTANDDGYFTLSLDQSDSINLIVSYLGFNTEKYRVKPSEHSPLQLVELKPYSFEVVPVVIKGSDETEMVRVGSKQRNMTVNVSQVTGMPSLHPLDVILPLQLLPGIDGTTETSSGLRIRKSSPDKTLILYDGYPVYSIDHLYGMLSSFNQKTIKDIQVHKGISDARFDGSPGGVIEITGKTGNKKNLSIDAGIDFLNANIVAEAPIGRHATVITSYRRSYSDIYQTPFYRKQFKNLRYDIENNSHMPPSFLGSDPEIPEQLFSDFTAKLTLAPTLKSQVSVSTFIGNDEISFQNKKTGGEISENSDKMSSGAGLRWAMQWNPVFYSNILAGYSAHNTSFRHIEKLVYNRPQITANSNLVGLQVEQTNEISDFSVEMNNSLLFSDYSKLDFGIKSSQVSTNFTDVYNQEVGPKALVRSDKKITNEGNISTFYLQHNLRLKKLSYLDAGIRASWFSITRQFFLEPRISVNYEVIRGFSLKGYYGKYSQFNNRIVITDQSDYQYLWSLADKDHPVVISNQVGSGIVISPGHGFTFDMEMYRKETTNLMAVQNILLYSKLTDASQLRKYFHYDNVTRGIDFFLKKQMGPVQLWASYTLSESTDRSTVLANNPEYPAIDHQPHEVKLFGMYGYKGWTLSSSWIYGSGKRWDRPASLSEMETTYKKNSVVLPPYHRMDAGLGKNSSLGGVKLFAAIKIFNVYNHKNILTRQYFVNDFPSALTVKSDYLQINEVTGSGIMVNLVLNVRF